MYQPIILKYDTDSLEPVLSSKTIETHYLKHYLSYLKKLNELLSMTNFDFSYPVKDIFKNISKFPKELQEDILYNAGGVVNHEMYFNELGKKQGNINDQFRTLLEKSFGSVDNFKNEFIFLANKLKGCGYIFLAFSNGNLILMSLLGQDTPYNYGKIPIMNIDLFEHAYYLDYLNDKSKYIDNFMTILNYEEISNNYLKIINN